MTLRQLEYLVTIVDTGSFTRAAELLHVTQPALSHQVRALERATGGPLLERLPRSVRLTPMGRAMLPHARATLAAAQKSVSAARQAAGLQCGEIMVATVYSLSLGVLPPVLKAWRRAHPGVHVRLFEHRHAGELAEAMAQGQADLAVGPEPSDWDGPVHPLGEEEFVVVVSPDDPAAGATGCGSRTSPTGSGSTTRPATVWRTCWTRCAERPGSSRAPRSGPSRRPRRRHWPRPASARRWCRRTCCRRGSPGTSCGPTHPCGAR